MTAPNDAVRLKGNFYTRPDFFTTDVGKGVTHTPAGVRMCALTPDFLIGFRDAVIYESGKAYRRVMKQCGRRWGTQFIRRFEAEISAHYGTPLAQLSAGVVYTVLGDAFAAHGWGSLNIDLQHIESGLISIELRNSVLPSLVAESDRPVDLLMTGLLAAVFTHLAGQNLDCVQTDCPSQGADASRFIIGQPSRVQELEQWLTRALPHAPAHHAACVRRFLAQGEDEAPARDIRTVNHTPPSAADADTVTEMQEVAAR
jgi:predicted hydrocarbon binding protein